MLWVSLSVRDLKVQKQYCPSTILAIYLTRLWNCLTCRGYFSHLSKKMLRKNTGKWQERGKIDLWYISLINRYLVVCWCMSVSGLITIYHQIWCSLEPWSRKVLLVCIDWGSDCLLYTSWRCRRYAVCRSRWSPYH